MKEEFKKDMENLRKKNQTETLKIKLKIQGHYSRLEQVEENLRTQRQNRY
jgi:hypothetical protein